MDLTQFALSLLKNNPAWVKKLENLTGQPADYSIKCINSFLDQLNLGPGLKKPEDKRLAFRSNYELVMGLGCFKDYEAQILAGDMSGFSLAEVVQHFRLHLKWDTNVDEIMEIHKELVPKFKTVAKKAGLLKDEETEGMVDTEVEKTIPPNVGKSKPESKDGSLTTPPWKKEKNESDENYQPMGEFARQHQANQM